MAWIKKILCDRVQRVSLDGKTSDWECIQADLPLCHMATNLSRTKWKHLLQFYE